ncbi:MAG: response regulator, partial [Aureliella sp.]
MENKALILVVDDSPTQALCMRRLLQGCFDVMTVANGKLALAAIHEKVPDLVVTDLHMPEMDGLELVEALREEHPALPIVLTTSQGSEEIAWQALRRGASSYVPKRHLRKELLPTVARFVSMLS